ncbi:hypothetical protein NPA07_01005 [Mycoplasmopsis caviae]|uniref:Uncharacterized protein n=1 Tax=Mycoplasmopsis caviae TaxID=55603 RepID=A0A3P8L6W0_9BACT|nr:hypothetical protein [Mycoplasmopsis caviae]UUD35438.1 hypothetical protein NPA07_01005 [Mycoplasmopsis caviae]VDR41785.1 Uncharacterised protein [Mycoplasmopsis caviae]
MQQNMTMWIILGVLVAVLGSFFVWSAIKEKIKRKQRRKQELQFRKDLDEQVRLLVFALKILIDKNNDYLTNFQPSIGEYKMSNIVNTAHKFLEKYQEDPLFKECILSNADAKEEIFAFSILRDTRSNSWNKRASDKLEWVSERFNSYDLTLYEDDYKKMQERINEYYDAEFLKNDEQN